MLPVQALTGAQCKEQLVWKGLGSWRNIPLHGDTRGQGAAPRVVPSPTQPRTASGFLLGCRHQSSAERNQAKASSDAVWSPCWFQRREVEPWSRDVLGSLQGIANHPGITSITHHYAPITGAF